MATQAVKVKNDESGSNAITGAAAGIGQRVSGTVADTREFMHDVRVEMTMFLKPAARAWRTFLTRLDSS